jgi:tRNA dimethylallyltransferase
VDEVAALLDRPGGMGRTAAQALGYKELAAHLRGELTLDGAIELAVRRTRRFARRQRSWFRRDPRIRWHVHDGNPLALLDDLLGEWHE